MTVPDLIAAANERLTPTERRIAKAVLADPTLLAFGTVSELAERVGTSRPSIVRFSTKLGFRGYAHLKGQVRDDLTARLSRPSQRIRRQEEARGPARAGLEDAIRTLFEAVDGDRLAALAAPIASGRRVWIVTGETSRAGAHALCSGLSIVRPGVHLIEEQSGGREMASASEGDTAVVLDFARYRQHSVTTARTLAGLGVNIVAITDSPLSPLAALSDTWCELKVPAIGPFDSSVPAVAMAELLVAQVATLLRDDALTRIDRTEALWKAFGTFLPESEG